MSRIRPRAMPPASCEFVNERLSLIALPIACKQNRYGINGFRSSPTGPRTPRRRRIGVPPPPTLANHGNIGVCARDRGHRRRVGVPRPAVGTGSRAFIHGVVEPAGREPGLRGPSAPGWGGAGGREGGSALPPRPQRRGEEHAAEADPGRAPARRGGGHPPAGPADRPAPPGGPPGPRGHGRRRGGRGARRGRSGPRPRRTAPTTGSRRSSPGWGSTPSPGSRPSPRG